MIYLTRTTIAPDGTRMIEIAALEDSGLAEYEAQGFVPCSYEDYSAAWRTKHTRLYERQLAAGPIVRAQASTARCCPECSHDKITVFVGGKRHCRRCKNNW